MSNDRRQPSELRAAIDTMMMMSEVPFRELTDAAARLSESYRQSDENGRHDWRGRTDVDWLAYVATRMPATFASTLAVFQELHDRCQPLVVRSLLDVGSGPATGLWAADAVFSDLARATLLEPEAGMREIGARLLQGAELSRRVVATWEANSATSFVSGSSFDVVLAAYVLGELTPARRDLVIDAMWDINGHAVVVIEPGSADGFQRVIAARARLIQRGASIVAPCPHARACPLPADDWCHFGARLNRSSLHRRLKGGTLGYEDEPYAYIVATRAPIENSAARVIRRPRTRPGHVLLRLCAHDGLQDETISRRSSKRYRLARKLAWGDRWVDGSALNP